jgi:hypothetical protein
MSSHDFDFLAGSWKVRHRRLKERLKGCTEWEECGGTSTLRPIMGGCGNVDDNVIELPSGTYRAASVRAYDAASGQWAIWWIDGRTPHNPLDPGMRGRFEDGVGTFFADETFEGRPIRVRFLWTDITPASARWQQAFSEDGGASWETNWVMDFERQEAATTAS